jgi:hypothetical protein
MRRSPGWFREALNSGELARAAQGASSWNEVARRLGVSSDALLGAKVRAINAGAFVPTLGELQRSSPEREAADAESPKRPERDGANPHIGSSLESFMAEQDGTQIGDVDTQGGYRGADKVIDGATKGEKWPSVAAFDAGQYNEPDDAVRSSSRPRSGPRILLLDIETAPATAYVWKLFDENIGLDQLIAPSRMLCWAAKWYRGGWHVADERGDRRDMLASLHSLLSEADAVATYNGDRFDLPKINGEFLAAGLRPVPPIPSIDLYKTAKRFGYQSNKLMFVARHLGIGSKIATGGFKLWADVMSGDEKAWAKMLRYNKQDVALLERLYTKLRPYIKTHPALYTRAHNQRCQVCGASKLQRRGSRRTRAFVIERLHCQGCGAWSDGQRSR